MKYLSKVMNLDWLGKKKQKSNDKSKFSIPHDVSVAHFEDEGGIYLLGFDGWSRKQMQEFCEESGFAGEWERKMENTGLAVISGRIGKDEEIEIVHTSLDEIFDNGD